MTDHSSPEKSPWGWKALIIAIILSIIFMIIFYAAISNEPDYMPSQKNKETSQHHAFKESPLMSAEALAEAEKQKLARETAVSTPSQATTTATATEHNMSADEHAAMSDNHAEHTQGTSHGH